MPCRGEGAFMFSWSHKLCRRGLRGPWQVLPSRTGCGWGARRNLHTLYSLCSTPRMCLKLPLTYTQFLPERNLPEKSMGSSDQRLQQLLHSTDMADAWCDDPVIWYHLASVKVTTTHIARRCWWRRLHHNHRRPYIVDANSPTPQRHLSEVSSKFNQN